MQIQTEYHGYFLKECLKQDEYSRVYRGQASEETTTDSVVKVFNIQLLSLRERQRFLQETNLLTSLRHPALLPLLEAGINKGNPYLVRAYAPEGSLVTQLFKQNGETFPLSTVMNILTRIATAVTYLHQKHISHGSIKPENILFDGNRQAFLADIRLTSLHSSTSSAVQTPMIVAEEGDQRIQRTVGQDDKERSMQDDVYALSIIAYELLTGHQPFTSSSAHDATPVPSSHWMPSLSREVDSVFSQALNPHPDERFSSATLFVKALQRALDISVQDDTTLVMQKTAPLLQIPTQELVLFQPQVKAQHAGSTRFTGQSSFRAQIFVKGRPSIFSIKSLFILLTVLLILIAVLVPVLLFHPYPGSKAITIHKTQNQVPTRQTHSIAPHHVVPTVSPIKHQKSTPIPTQAPTASSKPIPTPVIVNAGFEFPNLNGDYEYAPNNSGWAFSEDCGIAGNGSNLTANTANAPWGTQVAFIQAYGTMSQNVSFAQGMYRISFLAAQRTDSSSMQSLWVIIDNTVVGSFTPVGGNYLYYTTPSFTVSPGIHTLQFRGLKGGAHNTVFIDSVAAIH